MNAAPPEDRKPVAAQPSAAAEVETSLYEVRKKIYPRAVTGLFAGWRWSMVWITQLVFYGLPWLSWNDRQAVLFDLVSRRFYLFGIVLYPQDFIYLTGLLVISALGLFLFTAVGGRLWCGYACPQTVYTEIFMWIERKVEGDRPKRIKLDREPLSAAKFGTKAVKHGLWIAVALWTGFTFVGYFTPIRTLTGEVISAALGPWETFWVLFYGFATYGNAGFMREQVCKYMCPYARFQSSMFDKDTMIITQAPRPSAFVSCNLCVEVCPTGIDIRNGLQYERIGCAACVDACDQVMDRMGYPRGLIRYDTQNGLANHWTRKQVFAHMVRPRVLVYSAILVGVTVALFAHMLTRVPLKVDVIRDRGTLGREVEDGMIENVYRLQMINSAESPRRYRIGVSGIESAFVASETVVEVEKAGTRMVPVRVRIKPGVGQPGSNTVRFEISAEDDPSVAVHEKSTFYIPR